MYKINSSKINSSKINSSKINPSMDFGTDSRECQNNQGEPRVGGSKDCDFIDISHDAVITREVSCEEDQRVAKNEVIIKNAQEVRNLIKGINDENGSDLSITKMVFPSITASDRNCSYKIVQELFNICSKLKLLEEIYIIENNKQVTIDNVLSLKILSFKYLEARFELKCLSDLIKIMINNCRSVIIIDSSSKLPNLRYLIIDRIYKGKLKIKNRCSCGFLEEIRIEKIYGGAVSINGGSKSLKTLILGDESLRASSDCPGMVIIKITGIYSNLQLLHIRSGKDLNDGMFPFEDGSLMAENFPLLGYCGKFIDESVEPDVDPRVTSLNEEIGIRKGKKEKWLALILPIIMIMYEKTDQQSIFSQIPRDITRFIVNILLQRILFDLRGY